MSRTHRAYHDRMSLRHQSNKPHKRHRSLLQELVRDASLELDFPIRLGNRALFNEVPEPYDDKPVAALQETKRLWKH